MAWWSRLGNVFRQRGLDRDLEEEMRFHLDERARALVTDGLSPEEARAEALRRFGSPLRCRESSRDVRLLPEVDAVLRDVRYGLRALRRDRAVTGAAVVSLGLALGACLAAFPLVDALILRPLPVRAPDELVYLVYATGAPERPESDTFSDPLFLRLRDAARGHVDFFAMSTQVVRAATFVDAGGEKERLRTQYVSGDAFERLGVGPALGRVIAVADDSPTATPVAVISYGFWQGRFAGAPEAIGRSFELDGRHFAIVGVAAPGSAGIEPGRPPDVWLPYGTYNPPAFGNFEFNWFRIVGRVAPDESIAQAQDVAQAAFTSARRDFVPRLGPGRSPEGWSRTPSPNERAKSASAWRSARAAPSRSAPSSATRRSRCSSGRAPGWPAACTRRGSFARSSTKSRREARRASSCRSGSCWPSCCSRPSCRRAARHSSIRWWRCAPSDARAAEGGSSVPRAAGGTLTGRGVRHPLEPTASTQ